MQFVLSDIAEQYCTCQSHDFYCCVKSAVNEVKFCNILWHVGDFFYHAVEFCKNFRKFHGTSQDLMSRGKSCALFIIYYSLCVLMLSRQCCWVIIFILSISLRIFTFMQLCDHFKILMKCVCYFASQVIHSPNWLFERDAKFNCTWCVIPHHIQ